MRDTTLLARGAKAVLSVARERQTSPAMARRNMFVKWGDFVSATDTDRASQKGSFFQSNATSR